MDILQEYLYQAYTLYQTADPYLRPFRTFVYKLQIEAYTFLLPYLNKLAALAQDSPAVVTVAAFLFLLVVIIQVVNFMRRIMMFWMKVLVRLAFWGAVGLMISLVAQRGVGRSVEDVVSWGGELKEVWLREYTRWEGYSNTAAKNQGGAAFGSGSGSGKNWS